MGKEGRGEVASGDGLHLSSSHSMYKVTPPVQAVLLHAFFMQCCGAAFKIIVFEGKPIPKLSQGCVLFFFKNLI